MKSWVILFKDGRHSLAWGETAEAARISFLKCWADGIERVANAGEFKSQLSPAKWVGTPDLSPTSSPYPANSEQSVPAMGRVYPEELPGG
jgi:hypothetical protein